MGIDRPIIGKGSKDQRDGPGEKAQGPAVDSRGIGMDPLVVKPKRKPQVQKAGTRRKKEPWPKTQTNHRQHPKACHRDMGKGLKQAPLAGFLQKLGKSQAL